MMKHKLEPDEVLVADGLLDSMAHSPNGGDDSGRPCLDGTHLSWSPISHLGLLEMLAFSDFNLYTSVQ